MVHNRGQRQGWWGQGVERVSEVVHNRRQQVSSLPHFLARCTVLVHEVCKETRGEKCQVARLTGHVVGRRGGDVSGGGGYAASLQAVRETVTSNRQGKRVEARELSRVLNEKNAANRHKLEPARSQSVMSYFGGVVRREEVLPALFVHGSSTWRAKLVKRGAPGEGGGGRTFGGGGHVWHVGRPERNAVFINQT